jgi:hypothetical protein
MKRVRGYPNGLHAPARIVSAVSFSDSLQNIFVSDRSKNFSHTTGHWAETQTGTDFNHPCLPIQPPEAQPPIVKNSLFPDYFVRSVSWYPVNLRFGNDSKKVSTQFLNWSFKLCGGTI